MAENTEVSKLEIGLSLLAERFEFSHLFVSVPNSLNFLSTLSKENPTVQSRGFGGRFGRSTGAPSSKS